MRFLSLPSSKLTNWGPSCFSQRSGYFSDWEPNHLDFADHGCLSLRGLYVADPEVLEPCFFGNLLPYLVCRSLQMTEVVLSWLQSDRSTTTQRAQSETQISPVYQSPISSSYYNLFYSATVIILGNKDEINDVTPLKTVTMPHYRLSCQLPHQATLPSAKRLISCLKQSSLRRSRNICVAESTNRDRCYLPTMITIKRTLPSSSFRSAGKLIPSTPRC